MTGFVEQKDGLIENRPCRWQKPVFLFGFAITLKRMTIPRHRFVFDKYAKLECFFFVFVWLIVPLMSGIEYRFYEPSSHVPQEPYGLMLLRRLVWAAFGIVPFLLFYRLAIQRLLVRRKYWRFIIAFLVFIVFLELFTVYVMYGAISKMGFLPVQMTKEAARWMKQKGHLHFTISYLILQLLQMAALAYYINYDRQEKQVLELRRRQAETDLQYLKAQIQPHFFFNTLNNIYSLALQQSQATAPLVARLSDMMRYVLYESSRERLPLTEEISFVSNYIGVQSVRYNNRIDIRFDSQGISDRAQIAPLLLLPFVENAFKHGIEEETGRGYVDIVVFMNNDELTLYVKNSKVQKAAAQRKGIGIDNARKRLQLLYPGKYSLAVKETDSDYAVTLTITPDLI